MMEIDFHIAIAQFIGGIFFFFFVHTIMEYAGQHICQLKHVIKATLFIWTGFAITFYVPLVINRALDGKEPIVSMAIFTSLIVFPLGWIAGHFIRDIIVNRRKE